MLGRKTAKVKREKNSDVHNAEMQKRSSILSFKCFMLVIFESSNENILLTLHFHLDTVIMILIERDWIRYSLMELESYYL